MTTRIVVPMIETMRLLASRTQMWYSSDLKRLCGSVDPSKCSRKLNERRCLIQRYIVLFSHSSIFEDLQIDFHSILPRIVFSSLICLK